MIGIDITDLSDPLLKSREHALRLISHPKDKTNQETSFWHLWCSKEAVFKVYRKIQAFSPTSIPIQFLNNSDYHSNETSGRIEENVEFLCSIASVNSIFDYKIIERKTSDPSMEIRDSIRQWFKNKHNVQTSVTEDEQGLPILSHNHSPISTTHHGRYLAFAYIP